MLIAKRPTTEEIPSLYAELEKVPDPRDEQGKRHPLPAMLALASVALLCNYQTPNAISEWVDNYGREYLERFGFTYPESPGQAAWYRVLGAIDWTALEARVTPWSIRVLRVLERHTALEGIAIDGKPCAGVRNKARTRAISSPQWSTN